MSRQQRNLLNVQAFIFRFCIEPAQQKTNRHQTRKHDLLPRRHWDRGSVRRNLHSILLLLVL